MIADGFFLIPTIAPNVVMVAERVFTANLHQDMMPEVGDMYAQIKFGERKRVGEKWDEYIFAFIQPSQQDGYIEFVYVPPVNRDSNGKMVLEPFRVTPSFEDYPWPAMLEDLPDGKQIDFIFDSKGYPLAREQNGFQVQTARVMIDYLMRSPWPGKTYIETKEYISPVPMDRQFLFTKSPVAETVRFELLSDLKPDVRELHCLHKEIAIPAFGLASHTNTTTQDVTFTANVTAERTYAETNMTEWESHQFYAHQEYSNGLYYIVTKRAFAPPMDPLTTDAPTTTLT